MSSFWICINANYTGEIAISFSILFIPTNYMSAIVCIHPYAGQVGVESFYSDAEVCVYYYYVK